MLRQADALERALEASVLVDPKDYPCQWSQPVPCKNIALLQASDGSMLCHPHFEWFERELLRSSARPIARAPAVSPSGRAARVRVVGRTS